MRTWFLVAALALPALADEPTPESLFHEGWYKETGLKDLEGAISAYERVVTRSREAEAYAARAQYQIGVCLEKLGKTEASKAAFKKVVESYPEQKEWADKARERLAGQAEEPKDPSEQVIAKMKATKISLNFTEAPLTDALTFLREYSQMNILIDAEVRNPEGMMITMRVDEIPMDQAFDLLLKMHDLDWYVEDGVIIASTEQDVAGRAEAAKKPVETDADAAAWKAEMKRVLENTKIDLDFTDATLEDIICFFREYARLNIEIDQEVRADGTTEKKVTFQLRQVSLRNALTLLLKQYGLTYDYVNHVLLIKRDETPR